MAYINKAKMRTGQVDPLADMKADPRQDSNQVRFATPVTAAPPVGPNQGKAVVGPNTKGTGKLQPTAIQLAGKRKLGVKLPANF